MNNNNNSFWFCSKEHAELSVEKISKEFGGAVFLITSPIPDYM